MARHSRRLVDLGDACGFLILPNGQSCGAASVTSRRRGDSSYRRILGVCCAAGSDQSGTFPSDSFEGTSCSGLPPLSETEMP
ncbi:unnamed protein product [Urochloa humidicola]